MFDLVLHNNKYCKDIIIFLQVAVNLSLRYDLKKGSLTSQKALLRCPSILILSSSQFHLSHTT